MALTFSMNSTRHSSRVATISITGSMLCKCHMGETFNTGLASTRPKIGSGQRFTSIPLGKKAGDSVPYV